MTRKHLFLGWLIVLLGFLSGCASFSKGITEAILDRKSEDTRQCWITGREFDGLESQFGADIDQATGTSSLDQIRVLKVHGIGNHEPGYSRRLQDGLVAEFEFEAMDETVKTVSLIHPNYPGSLGILRVHRYIDLKHSRELLFYELTWDPIIEEEKQLLSFDNTEEASARRVPFNHTLKTFINATVPDVLMYNTKYREPIQLSIAQAICWMISETWEGLPNNQEASCRVAREDYGSQVRNGSISIIAHSMGSRISIDALQTTVSRLTQRADFQDISEKARDKPMFLYMLSNQLPLLQLGQPLPRIHDQVKSFCSSAGDHYGERFLNKLQIVAFSDPNDLFSYAVSPEYINRYVDSRLCPSVTNVLIQVAQVTSILGLREIANPETAHTEYEVDSRVLKMLVAGFGKSHRHDEVRERCEFIEAIPDY